MDIVLIYPPFVNGFYPNYGLSSIKAVLNEKNISSKVIYANLFLKKRLMQFDFYESVCSSVNMFMLGEFVFAEKAHPEIKKKLKTISCPDQSAFHEAYGARLTSIPELKKIKNLVGDYLDELTAAILEEDPKIVGFHITFSQLNASIAIANEIKKKKNDIIITFGGYMAQYPMVNQILALCDSFDFAFSGEAENVFSGFAENYIRHKKLPANKIMACRRIPDLNELPIPDFDDFFLQSNALGMQDLKAVLFESSRGCWWGDKSKCLFCGTCDNLKYKQKSVKRINEELKILIKRYKPKYIIAVDNIIPKVLLKDNMLRINKKTRLFYEVKPNLNFKSLSTLKRNNIIDLQPGIETLNSKLLKILKKGTTSITNLKFLRDCRELKINIAWSFLYGIPGEREEDYLDMMNYLPLLYHLQPPLMILPMMVQRFSPFFDKMPDGNKPLPFKMMKNLFPDNIDCDKLSVYFRSEHPVIFTGNQTIKKSFFSMIDDWNICFKKNTELVMKSGNNGKYIIDTRPVSGKKRKKINYKQYRMIKMLNKSVKIEIMREYISNKNIENEFRELMDEKLIISIDGFYFSPVV